LKYHKKNQRSNQSTFTFKLTTQNWFYSTHIFFVVLKTETTNAMWYPLRRDTQPSYRIWVWWRNNVQKTNAEKAPLKDFKIFFHLDSILNTYLILNILLIDKLTLISAHRLQKKFVDNYNIIHMQLKLLM